MVDLNAAYARAGLTVGTRRRRLAERLACWMQARAERRRAEELDRLDWDQEASRDRRAAAKATRDNGPILPPGVGLR